MGRYTGPVCRQCRRVGEKLFLKGERCYTPKCAVDRRRTPPGANVSRRRRASDHSLQLREKQKVRFMYGIMEAQLENYMEKAFTRPTSTGQYLLLQLETRLDNVIYRLGFADSRRQARQLVTHGHFSVNGRKTDIPSYQVKEGNVIAWQETRKKKQYVQNLVQDLPKRPVPEWLELDAGNLTATVKRMPNPEELDIGINTRQIVEYYSR